MKPQIMVDLDGCLAIETGIRGNEIGEPFPGAAAFVDELSKYGDVVIYSCRTSFDVYGNEAKWNVKLIQNWLDKHGIKVASIYTGNGKPAAKFYIDNRGIRCAPADGNPAFIYDMVATCVKNLLL